MDSKVDLVQWFTIFFAKKTSDGAIEIKIMSNKELAKELHKPIKFGKRKVHSSFIDKIWGAHLKDLIKDLDFYYVLLILMANMHELFL